MGACKTPAKFCEATLLLTHLMILHYSFPSDASTWSCCAGSLLRPLLRSSYCETLHLSDCNLGFFLQPLGQKWICYRKETFTEGIYDP